MRSFVHALDAFRASLLAVSGVGLGGCPAIPSEPPDPDRSPPAQPTVATTRDPEPVADPTAAGSACESPRPILAASGDTGYVQCADGALDRAAALACANPITAAACQGSESQRACETDADCTDRPHGYCMGGVGQIGSYCSCIYPCHDDSECAPNEACMCPDAVPDALGRVPVVSQCAPAECRSHADCRSGECGATFHFNGCYHQLSLRCRDEGDACRSSGDCGERGGECAALPGAEGIVTSEWACARATCMIGRPLTVASEGGRARLAPIRTGAWGDRCFDSLARSRARADHWLGVARMEHASVASFARFLAELLTFAAPPDLVRDAAAAAREEVAHAELAFALASAYAGRPLAPGRLRTDDLAPARELSTFVERLVVEGCVGETVGVAELLALLAEDVHPQLRPVLERIADDEARHAALAWRTLTWVAGRVDPRVVDRAFDRAIRGVLAVDPERRDVRHGRLGTRAKRRIRALALAQLVEPCRRRLHASSGAQSFLATLSS